jgi:hypothetical protein
MAKHYTLAVWTATMAYNAKKIVNDVFTSKGIPLLFTWYNDMCVAHDGLGKPTYPSAAAAGAAAAVAAWRRPVEDSKPKEQGALIDLTEPPCDLHSQPLSSDTPSSPPPTADDSASIEDNETAPRTVMMKPLAFVWHSFPSYSEMNTVRSRISFDLISYGIFFTVYVRHTTHYLIKLLLLQQMIQNVNALSFRFSPRFRF